VLGQLRVVNPRPAEAIANEIRRDPKQVVLSMFFRFEGHRGAKETVVRFLQEIVGR
jgi:hypothetical protein